MVCLLEVVEGPCQVVSTCLPWGSGCALKHGGWALVVPWFRGALEPWGVHKMSVFSVPAQPCRLCLVSEGHARLRLVLLCLLSLRRETHARAGAFDLVLGRYFMSSRTWPPHALQFRTLEASRPRQLYSQNMALQPLTCSPQQLQYMISPKCKSVKARQYACKMLLPALAG